MIVSPPTRFACAVTRARALAAGLLALGTLPFLAAVVLALRRPADAAADAWGGGNSLEWATSSPPPEHASGPLPPVRSERPVHDLRHAQAAEPPPAGGDPAGTGSSAPPSSASGLT